MSKKPQQTKSTTKPQCMYCVISDGNDEFDIPTEGKLRYYEVAVGPDIADLVNNVEEDDWDINDALVVYKLVPVGHITRSKPTFNKLGEASS